MSLFGKQPLIRDAWDRAVAVALPSMCYVVSSHEHGPFVRQFLPELPFGNLILEPEAKDTAAAVALALGYAAWKAPKSIMLVLPSDHVIGPIETFARQAKELSAAARAGGTIGLFGIEPSSPATCYGYVRMGNERNGVLEVASFMEKPSLEAAKEYVSAGLLWNAGIFAFPCDRLMSDLRLRLPHHADMAARISEDGVFGAASEFYPLLPRFSIDKGIMEHASGVVALRAVFSWDDVGSWSSASKYCRDEAGNAVGGKAMVTAVDAAGNMIVSSGRRKVAIIGVEGLAVIDGPGGLLVCKLEDDQKVKAVAD
jgi:mannose-1-phosphate guanylyltransferase